MARLRIPIWKKISNWSFQSQARPEQQITSVCHFYWIEAQRPTPWNQTYKTDLERNSFYFRTPTVWKSLHSSSRLLNKLDNFKKNKLKCNKTRLRKVTFVPGTITNLNKDVNSFIYYQLISGILKWSIFLLCKNFFFMLSLINSLVYIL